MTQKPVLGWIGLGTMGKPMATRLAESGYTVIGCGTGKKDLSLFSAESGITIASGPKEIAQKADILFSMIPDGNTLLNIISGNNGIACPGLRAKLLVDMSTVDPQSSAKAANLLTFSGARLLRAPVTGSVHFAKKGSLGIMVSGSQEDYELCMPYFNVLGSRCTYLGSGEEARYVKVIINMLLANILQSFSESLVLGEKLNLPWEVLIDLIADSAAAAPIIQYKADAVKVRNFTPTSTGYNMHKDMKIAVSLAQQSNLSLPVTAASMQVYNSLISNQMSQLDSSAILMINEKANGISY